MKRARRFSMDMIGLVLGAGSCASGTTVPVTAGVKDAVLVPSIVELIAHPANYVGSRVLVRGFLGEGVPALFLTRELAEMGDSASFEIVDHKVAYEIVERCSGHYVEIEGEFVRTYEGPQPANFGIDDVRSVAIYENGDYSTCWKARELGRACGSARSAGPAPRGSRRLTDRHSAAMRC